MPAPVIIDADPGRDDAVALILACGAGESGGLDVRAVTTVAGNVPVDKTTTNALRVLALAGRTEIPVAAGAVRPLYRSLVTAEHVHGESGLAVSEGLRFPDPASTADSRGAVDLASDAIEGSDEPVTLVAVGPLTNVATLLQRRPGLRENVGRIVLMGGSIGPGNTTPAAEFNIYVDPEAARDVFESGVPVTMVGLDATRRALATEEHLRRLASMGRVGEVVVDLLVEPAWRPRGGTPQPVHDAVAVAAALEPGVLVTRPMRVEVECAGEHTTGETVCDPDGVSGKAPNAEVAVDLDASRVMELLLDAVGRL